MSPLEEPQLFQKKRLIQHFYFGLVHFQDCDSSVLFEYLDQKSILRMKSFIDKGIPEAIFIISP